MRNWITQIFSRTNQTKANSPPPSVTETRPVAKQTVDHQAPLNTASPNPGDSIPTWIKEGFDHLQNGNDDAAQELFDRVLQRQPNHADALYMSGLIAINRGQLQAAGDFISRAITSDGSVAAFHLTLANILIAQQRHSEALACFDRALKLEPENAQALNDFGHALFALGNPSDAIERLHQALELEPLRQDIRYNLATILQEAGSLEDAVSLYRDIVATTPDYIEAWNNLGSALHALGRPGEAVACFKRVIDLKSDHTLAWSNLGCALQASRKVDEAETTLLHAVALDPGNFDAYSNLALAQRELGKLEASRANSRYALAISDRISERVRLATLLPVIGRSRREIEAWRQHFHEAVSELLTGDYTLERPLQTAGVSNFNLAYQPECDRTLQEKTAQLYTQLCPSLRYTSPHCNRQRAANTRIKVGFISKFMYAHSIGRTTRGLLANISRDEFEVTALFVPPMPDDAISLFIRENADNHVLLPNALEAARETIAGLELDILFYQDIGMEAYTYFLAFSRLAPVQCVSFGHPDTTGIPNMDYWVSTEGFEPKDAAMHYSEQLYLLRNIATLAYYYRPALVASAKTRNHFGLSDSRTLYICPQALFKLHPDFDDIVAGILRGDPNGEVVLIEASNLSWGKILRERFQQAIPDVATRIRFVPGMNADDFLALVALADVVLDTIYFNGMNTSLEAFSFGVPIVTMPTALQRGRHTSGMYKQMGILDCIAASPRQYVEIALHLGTDRGFRDAVSKDILSHNGILYEDVNVVREFERFFRDAHALANQKLLETAKK